MQIHPGNHIKEVIWRNLIINLPWSLNPRCIVVLCSWIHRLLHKLIKNNCLQMFARSRIVSLKFKWLSCTIKAIIKSYWTNSVCKCILTRVNPCENICKQSSVVTAIFHHKNVYIFAIAKPPFRSFECYTHNIPSILFPQFTLSNYVYVRITKSYCT